MAYGTIRSPLLIGLTLDALVGDHSEAAGAIVVERAGELFVRVHHKWPVPGDRFADRQTAHDIQTKRRRVAILLRVGADANRVATAEHRQLAGANRPPFASDVASAAQDVDQRVEVWAPRDIDLGTRLDCGVVQRDGR